MVIQAYGAERAGGRRRRPRAVEPADREQVPVTRVMVTAPEFFDDAGAAGRWLEATAGDAEARAAAVRSATRVVNEALHALRAAARDPLVHEVGATRALSVRIGYGEGAELAEGRWSEAMELPPPRRGRLDDIDPQASVAAVLGSRERVHPAETLLQRARLDIQQGRRAEASYGLRAAAAALADDPDGAPADLRERIAEAEDGLGRILGEEEGG
jgi:hypothetical protein